MSSRPNRSTHARTASMIASTASPRTAGGRADRDGLAGPARRSVGSRMPAGSPRAAGQPAASHAPCPPAVRAARAIRRCPTPAAARRSASPITSAPSRRRGTIHEGESTCVVSQPGAARPAGREWPNAVRAAAPRASARTPRATIALSRPGTRAPRPPGRPPRAPRDRDREHRRSVVRSRPPNPPRRRRGREGATRVAHLPHPRRRRPAEAAAPSPP